MNSPKQITDQIFLHRELIKILEEIDKTNFFFLSSQKDLKNYESLEDKNWFALMKIKQCTKNSAEHVQTLVNLKKSYSELLIKAVTPECADQIITSAFHCETI